MPDTCSTDTQPALRCRPTKGNLGWILLFALFGGCLAALPGTAEHPMPPWGIRLCWAIAGACAVASVGVALWVARAEVALDEEGLAWRHLFGRRRVPWDSVADYYLRPIQWGRVEGLRPAIEAGRERLQLYGEWAESDALREWVQRKAARARVSEWSILGHRPEDGQTHVLHYRTRDNLFTSYALPGLGIGMLWLAASPGVSAWRSGLLGSQPQLVGVYVAASLLMALLLGGLLAVVFILSRDARRRLGERITTSPQGITFAREGRQVHAAWDEVTDCTVNGDDLRRTRCIVTRRGTIEFTIDLSQPLLLMEVVAREAAGLSGPPRRTMRSDDVLGGDRLRWTGGQPGAGQRVFHYRTRTCRAMLALVTSMPVVVLIAHATARLLSVPLEGIPAVWLMVAGAPGSAAAFAWWYYFAASVRTDEDGITQYSPLARRHIPWAEVQAHRRIRWAGHSFGVVEGGGRRILFSRGITDLEELEAEIARRSVNSQTRGW